MYRRRFSPYSNISEIRESRGELIALAVTTVVLGILLNILAAVLYERIVLGQPFSELRLVGFIVGLASALLIIGFIIWLLYNRCESTTVRMEVAVPYCLEGGQHIQIASQHRYRPPYHPAILGRQRFAAVCGDKGPAEGQLTAAWQSAQQAGTSFPDFMAPWHKALVDCLILDALHSYGQDSLSPKALIRMWQVPLPCYRVEIRDLPVVLQENTFVQTLTREAPEWKLLLPTGVKLEVKDVGGERIWSLLHRRYGRIVVRCLRHYWAADYDQKIGRALGEGLQPSQRRWFWVLGSRAEARASFRLAFLPRADSFHEWATGLLAYLEEELDWGYFERSRPDRMVVDLPWKIGDLPDNASVWGKLMDIETRLMQLETEIMAKAPPNSLPDDPSRPPFPRLTKA